MIKKWLAILFKTQRRDAEAKQIARHLARVALYELKGIEALYPDLKDKYKRLEARMKELGRPIWITEGFRTAKTQDKYYKKVPKVTNAKALQSYHNYGLAIDVVFKQYAWNAPYSWWVELGKEGEKLGLEWGGKWESPDRPHFELHQGFTWRDIIDYFKVV